MCIDLMALRRDTISNFEYILDRRKDCHSDEDLFLSFCYRIVFVFVFFFFQAEDGIRDGRVTGVQTCALPIWSSTDTTESALSAPENNAREIPRYDTRLTACVRVGSEDEMAVCENVSKQGIAFRSQRKYGVGTEVEIAVPFTAGTANVFIPAVIMHSRPLPSAGLNRHGAKYMHKDKT